MALKTWLGGTSAAWATGANWSGSSAPSASGDSAYFNQSVTTNGVDGSDQTATTLDLLRITSLYTKAFGSDGTPLQVKATEVRIHEPSGSGTPGTGSGRINLDLSTHASTVYVYGSSSSSTDTGKEPIRLKANSTSTDLNVLGGRVGIATDAIADTATMRRVFVDGGSTVVNAASGLTLTELVQADGTVTLNNAVTTISQSGGDLTTNPGNYLLTTASLSGSATFNHRKTAKSATLARSGAVATATSTSHGFSVGDWVMISGADQAEYNGVFVVATVADANTFTYYVNGSPATTATGTITASPASVTTLNIYEGATLDLSGLSTDILIAKVNIYGDCTIIRSAARPNHLGIGVLNYVRGTVAYQ